MNRLLVVLALSIAAFVLPTAPAAAATVTYSYTGKPLIYTGPFPGGNPYGSQFLGAASFDDSLVTPDFTGYVPAGNFTVYMGTPDGWAAGNHGMVGGYFRFTNGVITDWRVGTPIPFNPIAALQVVLDSYGPGTGHPGDYASPISGGLTVGGAGTALAGVWTREVAPVPLPAGLPLLAGALALIGALRRRTLLG